MRFEPVEFETGGQAPAILPQARQQLARWRSALHVELPLTHDMNFDVVSGLELQGFDHRGRQPDCQAVSPFGNLHDVSFDWRYTDFNCISFFSGDKSCTITRDEKKNVLEKAKA